MNCNECLWPWNHLYYNINGVYPCCKLADSPQWKLGDAETPVSEMWNSEKMKTLRKQFMAGQPPAECHACCLDTPSPYNVHIPVNMIGKKQQYYNETGPDGSFKENFTIFNMASSNLCNFKCAYCCSTYSSRIAEDSHIYEMFGREPMRRGVGYAYKDKDKVLKMFREQLPMFEKIYFSAGESHLQEIYYDMLRIMIETGHIHADVEFITNLSGYQTRYGNIFELLSQLKNVTLVASLDTQGERAEYIRHGTVWKEIEANRIELLSYPNIKFLLQPVVTNLSAFSLPDFHGIWYGRGFVGKGNVRYIILETPKELRVNNMPQGLKDYILEKYNDYLGFLKDEEGTQYNKMTPSEKVRVILNTMFQPPSITTDQFKLFIAKLNISRKTHLQTVFREFVDLKL